MPPSLPCLARHRLRVQAIEAPGFATPAEVVGWLGAMQSQEYGYAPWSIGKRAPAVDEELVNRALAEGTILRTHVLRPTWHYVRRQDIRWLLSATAPRVRRMMAAYDGPLELDAELYARTNDIIARAVEGGKHLTRTELAESLAAAGVDARGQRLAHIVMRAELDAIICSGRPRGKQITYALLAERAPDALVLDPEEALAELTRRYFRSHGPATEKDFRWWASLTAQQAKRGLQLIDGELARLTASGRTYWGVAEHGEGAAPAGVAHLLQAYDEYIVGYTESRDVLDTAGLARAVPRRNFFNHAIVLDGQLVGHWRRKLTPSSILIDFQFLRRLRRAEHQAIEDAVERYARFCGRPAQIGDSD